ncbi:hypothetical protein CVT26_010279 [Gymnopilus dilepis]|uniref:RING-type domain-containing protein n=1 Tax=Gymnopilus dilepis TaxID=231916 RepID=A0A409Y126_9AGAR|nr:hypothetical protein CVT26_010279 [Gymnopilus dilepis]
MTLSASDILTYLYPNLGPSDIQYSSGSEASHLLQLHLRWNEGVKKLDALYTDISSSKNGLRTTLQGNSLFATHIAVITDLKDVSGCSNCHKIPLEAAVRQVKFLFVMGKYKVKNQSSLYDCGHMLCQSCYCIWMSSSLKNRTTGDTTLLVCPTCHMSVISPTWTLLGCKQLFHTIYALSLLAEESSTPKRCCEQEFYKAVDVCQLMEAHGALAQYNCLMNDLYHQFDSFDTKLTELKTFIERIKKGSETLKKSIAAIEREIEDEKTNLNALQDLRRGHVSRS